MKISIHQSQYLPWPAYFKKIAMSDKFVILDNVQFQKNGIQNRNKLRNKNGEFWITIPVSGPMQEKINEKKCADERWKKKHFQSIIQSYSKCPYWEEHKEALNSLYINSTEFLNDINISFIKYFISQLDLKTEIFLSSQLNIEGSKSDLVMNICKKLSATEYIAGLGSKDYLDQDSFSRHSIKINFLESINPIYEQIHGKFIPDLSLIDMLMNVSKKNINNYMYQ